MNSLGFRLNQCMLRIKDPQKSIPFYTKYFNMVLIDELHFKEAKFSLYFLATILPGAEKPPTPGTEEAKIYRSKGDYGCCLELTHNHGTENMADFKYHSGNEALRGFGHIGFLMDDVYKLSDAMLADGISFKKKPDDGNMKGLAFAYDPDGYWIEMIKRSEGAKVTNMATFQQIMLRINDPIKSLKFYQDVCGMTLVQKLDFPQWKFCLYFLGHLTEEEKKSLPEVGSEEATKFLWGWEGTTIELTYNYDSNEEFSSGNDEPYRGFGHVCFMVDDASQTCDAIETNHKEVVFQKKPNEGRMKGLAFIKDPDGYWVELISRKSTKI